MTNQEILEKAIQKAIDGGWLPPSSAWDDQMTKENVEFRVVEGARDIAFGANVAGRIWIMSADNRSIPELIFNHNFAKALWGEQESNNLDCVYTSHPNCEIHRPPLLHETWHVPVWQYHLQQMVIADDPIKYLGENL